MTRPIDADKLKEHKFLTPLIGDYQRGWNDAIDAIIDNAPIVDVPNYGGQVVPDMLQGWRYEEKPQGEGSDNLCDTCKFSDNCALILKVFTGGKTKKCFKYEWAKKGEEE